jgi:hypothetical protein
MERTRWPDERLDERFTSIDRTLERIDRDIRDLRTEMRAGFSELRTELGGEIERLRVLMFRMFGGLVVALVVSSLFHGAA